jgi:invasion protein IalB
MVTLGYSTETGRAGRWSRARRSISVLGISFALMATSFTIEAAPQDGQQFKDWRVRCETLKDGKGKERTQCHMFQAIDLKNKKLDIALGPAKDALRLLTFQVAYHPNKPNQIVAFLTTPLGTSLLPGLRLKIDDGKELSFPFERCMTVGCRVAMAVTDKLIAELKSGKKANVLFHDMRGKGISLPVSLSGFTAGLRSLKE